MRARMWNERMCVKTKTKTWLVCFARFIVIFLFTAFRIVVNTFIIKLFSLQYK